ncbi:MAG: TIR domain-containing protein [Candidatus Scalindua sp.]|nr:TIR domain-containing protein [Candidatus Scalindua sp.]
MEATYTKLKQLGISVFYDASQVADLLGKNLYEYLSDVYQNQAKYCVVFLSKEYANKLWTKHELKSMQARAFQESREYILPARFDDTEIPGLLPAIAYIDLNEYAPGKFAELIADKVKDRDMGQEPIINPELEVNLTDVVIWAQEYLRPQSLDLSDAVAESVRTSFREAGIQPERQHLIPYIRNPRAEYRVVGYFAFQIDPIKEMVLDLINGLSHERVEATERKETRPLWQLLVCFTYLMQHQTPPADRDLIKKALKDFIEFMQNDSAIDPGGECRARIEMITGERWLFTA